MANSPIQVLVVIKSARGHVFVQGTDAIIEGQLTHANRRLLEDDEIHIRLDHRSGGRTSRLALLGRVNHTAAKGVDVKPGVSVTVDVVLLMKDGKDVSPKVVFGAPTTGPSPRVDAGGRGDDVSGLVGNLAVMSLTDLVQSMEVTRKTARVDVQAPDAVEGHVFVENGQVVHADWNHLTGEDAFMHLVEIDEGLFRVRFGKKANERSIRTSTTFLLMDALRRLDEAIRPLAFDEERTRTIVMRLPRTSVVGEEPSSDLDTLVTHA